MFEAVHGYPEMQSQVCFPCYSGKPLLLTSRCTGFVISDSTPVYCRSPRKAQRSPLTSDDEQFVVQKKVRMSVLRSNSNRSDSDDENVSLSMSENISTTSRCAAIYKHYKIYIIKCL